MTSAATSNGPVQVVIVEPPQTQSLRWLVTQMRMDPANYPVPDYFVTRVEAMVENMSTDDDCVPASGSDRVRFEGERKRIGGLLYRLCTPGVDVDNNERFTKTCNSEHQCWNPRHMMPVSVVTKRQRELQKNQYGNTRLTEDILRIHYPTEIRARPAIGKRVAYKQTLLFVRVAPTRMAHVMRNKGRSAQLYLINKTAAST